MHRLARIAARTLVLPLSLSACGPSEAAKVPERPLTEADARIELEAAKQKKDALALIDVFNKYSKFPSGREALQLGVRMLIDSALESAEACNDEGAARPLAHVAPYTTDDPEIDSAYDEAKTAIAREHHRCELVRLDGDVKKAEAQWDWPRAFNRIASEKDAEGAALKKRRLEVTDRWRAWLDETLKLVLAKKSFAAALGDKREAFEAAIDPEQLPPELGPEIEKRAGMIHGLRVVFDQLDEAVLLDPPVKYWTYGSPKARKPDLSDGAVLPQGIEFHAIAKGKANGVTLLVAGGHEGDLASRLGSIKLLIPEADARTFDTRMSLPEQLVGARVLAPIASGSDTLAIATVLVENNGAVVVQPLGKKGAKVAAKKNELRGLYLSPGQKVTVMVGLVPKAGEIADVAEEERVLVRLSGESGGFESFFPIGDVRVKRANLPPLPAE